MVPVDGSAKSVAHLSPEENISANAIGNTKSISYVQNARTTHKAVNHRMTQRRVIRAVYAFFPFDLKHNLSFFIIGNMSSGYYVTHESFLIFHFAYS